MKNIFLPAQQKMKDATRPVMFWGKGKKFIELSAPLKSMTCYGSMPVTEMLHDTVHCYDFSSGMLYFSIFR